MKHYVIGDVHGHYRTLLALVQKLPKDARLVFVGDLVDRGPQSMEVVKFVREGGHLCVMGNHEELMIAHGQMLIDAYRNGGEISLCNNWFLNGGVHTARSYGIVKLKEGKPAKVEAYEKALCSFQDDLDWMESLPLYIELDAVHHSGLPVVVSHGAVATVWGLRKVDAMFKTFRDMALWNRKEPGHDTKIFNIFGHTPTRWEAEVQSHYVNVDTGCYVGRNGYNKLSAYCVETGEVVSVESVG